MKILVCISKVPDTTTKISFTDNNTKFNTDKVQYIVNPYDEWYSLVRALEIKEAIGGSVTVINVGPAENDQIIRKALAIGADDAVRVDAEPADGYYVAAQIAEYAKSQSYDIVFTGSQSIDYNGFEVGGMLAELMDLPYIPSAVKLDVNGNTATVEREIVGGKEVVEVNTPFLLSTQKGMAEARIPNMRGIMAARTKPLNVVQPADVQPLAGIREYSLPPEKGDVKLVSADNLDELVQLLHNEAKVI